MELGKVGSVLEPGNTGHHLRSMIHKEIKKNISILAVGNVVATALPLLTFPIITRVLGPELYGKYGFAMSVAGFVMLLASPGFHVYGVRAVAQGFKDVKLLMARIAGIRILFCCAAIVVLGIYTLAWAPPDPLVRTLILLAALPLITTNIFSLDWLLIGIGQVTIVAASSIACQIVYTALVFSLLSSPEMVWIVPAAAFVSGCLGLLISYYYVWRRFGIAWPSFSLRDFREIVPPCLLVGLASLMLLICDKVDTIMLGYFRPMTEVGLYTATYRLMSMVMSFLPILSTVFFPLIAKQTRSHDSADSKLYLQFLFLAALPLIAGGMLLAEPLTAFIIGAEYIGAGTVFSFLLPNVLFAGLAGYYSGMRLLALNRNREYLIAVATGALLNVGLNLIAIPLWGGVGAAITTCLSQAAVASVGAWYGRDHRNPRLAGVAMVPFFASGCMIVVLVAVMSLVPDLHVLVLVGLGAIAYAGISMLVRISKSV